MTQYIDAEKLKDAIEQRLSNIKSYCLQPNHDNRFDVVPEQIAHILSTINSLQQEQDRMRYCIEYINPQYPLLDNGELNIRHLRVPDEHGAEMALTLMLSFGAKIYALYRGNVKDGKLGEWPTPMIVDAEDWFSVNWLHNILDCGCAL